MSYEQISALVVMFFVGAFSAIGLIDLKPGRARTALIAWVIAWCGPPLVALWLKGIVG